MKKGFIRNPQARISEGEASYVEEVAGRIHIRLFHIILGLFIILPVVYVLIVQTPGSWLPEEKAAAPVLNINDQQNTVSVNPFAKLDSAIIKASNFPNFENYFQLSFEFYKAGKFKESIKAAEKSLEYNPRSAQAYNNICSAYNELKEYTKAKEACERSLQIDPAFQLAKNNLSWAEKQLAAGNK